MNNAGNNEEFTPEKHPGGATVYYYLPEESDATIEVRDSADRLVHSFATDTTLAKEHGYSSAERKAGMHRLVWNLQYTGPDVITGAVMWGYTDGVKAPPGSYSIRMMLGDVVQEQTLNVLADPRLKNIPQADYIAQFELGLAVRDSINQVQAALRRIQAVDEQVTWIVQQAEKAGTDDGELGRLATALTDKLEEVNGFLMQSKNKSNQDPIRFAPQLDNQFVELYNYVTGPDGYIAGGAEGRPTAAAYQRMRDLNEEWVVVRQHLQQVFETELRAFNEAFERVDVSRVTVPVENQ